MRRKFLSVLLAMAMVLTLAPVTALAADNTATIKAVTISGKAGTALSDNPAPTIEVTLAGDSIVENEAKNVDNYTLNKPEDVTVAITYDNDNKKATLTLSGTPKAGSSDNITLTVKAAVFGDGASDVTATVANSGEAKWAIAAAEQPATTYTVGGTVSAGTTGADVKNLTVTLYPVTNGNRGNAVDTGTTGNDGAYTIGGTTNPTKVAAGSYVVVVAANSTAGYKESTADVAVSNANVTNADITLQKVTTDPEQPSGLTITPDNASISAGEVGTAASAAFTVSGGTAPYTVTKVSGPDWLSVAINPDTKVVTISGTRPATAQAAATFVLTIADKDSGNTMRVEVPVGAVEANGGSGSGSSGGSSNNNTNNDSSVKVPVSGDDHGVDVSADVSGSTATIDKIDGLDKVLDSKADTGVVEIDLTALKKDIDTVKLPAAALEDIAKAAADGDNDVDGLSVKLDSGTIEFDVDALAAIADQASGSTIDLKLEKAKSSDLNSKQKDAVKDMDIHGHFDLTMKGGKAITDFKGGKVSVKIPFSVPSGKDAANFVVIFVADDGTVEEMRTSCSGGYISFTTDHFSKYLIAYKEAEPVEPEPVPETPVTTECDGGADCPAGKFTDVNTDLWYHKAVDYVLTNGLMSGVGDSTFAPNANLSRAMLAQILYNQEGRPAVSADSVFEDVAAGMWYTNAIAWAAEEGVVSGLGDGKFGPNNNITREQLAVMLYRYAGSPSAAGSLDGFADAAKASGYAKDALVWATTNGVMSGKGGGMLDPQGQATRAEVAQMLYNYLNK